MQTWVRTRDCAQHLPPEPLRLQLVKKGASVGAGHGSSCRRVYQRTPAGNKVGRNVRWHAAGVVGPGHIAKGVCPWAPIAWPSCPLSMVVPVCSSPVISLLYVCSSDTTSRYVLLAATGYLASRVMEARGVHWSARWPKLGAQTVVQPRGQPSVQLRARIMGMHGHAMLSKQLA